MWRKSSHSFSNGNCIEVDSWRKSARCPHDTDCVEAGQGQGVIAVRDTKDRGTGPVLAFTPGQWRRFTGELAAAPRFPHYPGPSHPYHQDARDWWVARDA